jgi:hypothetical protein
LPGKAIIWLPAVRFGAIFACCFVLGIGVLLTPPVQVLDSRMSGALVGFSHAAIKLCGGHAGRQGAILRAPSGFAVEMRDGCNAVNVTILFWSAVLAPAVVRGDLLSKPSDSKEIKP